MRRIVSSAACLGLLVATVGGAARAEQDRPAPPPVSRSSAFPAVGWLGVFLGEALDGGVQVIAVLPASPAARGGVRGGDLLVAVNGRPASDRESADRLLRDLRPGQEVRVDVLRDGATQTLDLRAGSTLDAPLLLPGTRDRAWLRSVAPEISGGSRDEIAHGATWTRIPEELRRFWGSSDDAGVLVSEVEEGSPAAAAGLRVGDLVIAVGDRPTRSAAELRPAVLRAAVGGDPVTIRLLRNRLPIEVRLTVPPGYDVSVPLRVRGPEADVERLENELRDMRRRLAELEEELERLRRER